jgi:hypothetical protein
MLVAYSILIIPQDNGHNKTLINPRRTHSHKSTSIRLYLYITPLCIKMNAAVLCVPSDPPSAIYNVPFNDFD